MRKLQRLFAVVIYSLVYLISLLPMKLIYLMSDFAYLVAYYIVGYRRTVIIINLSRSFPEKKYGEIRKISRLYTRHMMNVFGEMLKGFSAGTKYYEERFVLENREVMDKYVRENRNIILICGHYANWEVLTYLPHVFTESPFYTLFKIQKSEISNILSLKMRTRFGMTLIPAKESVRFILGNKNNPSTYGFIADQSPAPSASKKYIFLNQPTLAYAGAEKLSKPLNAAVLYIDLIPQKERGYNKLKLIDMTGAEDITGTFLQLLENSIERAPQYWLWSHKRWKHKVSEVSKEG